MLEESLDLIVICPRYDDPVVGELRRLYKAPVWLLTNLCHAGVTVNIGGSPGFDRIRFEDRFFEPERLGGIFGFRDGELGPRWLLPCGLSLPGAGDIRCLACFLASSKM